MWTFLIELNAHSISPLHSKDFQLLWSSYIGLHRLRTTYVFPLSINLSLVKYLRQKIIILDAETSNLTTRKLQLVNAYMYGTRNNLKKDIGLHFNLHIFYTCKLVECHHDMHCLLRLKKDLRTKNKIFSSRRKR